MPPPPWRVSLHGGHSGEFCEHASGSLRAVLEAAVAAGYHTFGVSEHAPRSEPRFLYDTEIQKGFDIPRLQHDFENYAAALLPLIGFCLGVQWHPEMARDQRLFDALVEAARVPQSEA
jgi:histidinol phosphatase-like PHP family hydrolase